MPTLRSLELSTVYTLVGIALMSATLSQREHPTQ